MPDVAGDDELSHASEEVPTTAIDSAVSRPGRNPLPMSPKLPRICAHAASIHRAAGERRRDDRINLAHVASGPKRTFHFAPQMSAFGGKADGALASQNVR